MEPNSADYAVNKAKAILAQTKAEGSKPFAGSSYAKPFEPISPKDLSGGYSPVEIPTPPPSSASARASGFFDSMGSDITNENTFNTQLSREKQLAEAKSTADEKSLIDLQNKIIGVQGTRSDLQDEYNIAGKSQALTDAQKEVRSYKNQLIQEQTALNRQIEEIQKNSVGRETSGVNSAINIAKRDSLRKQADISLLGLVAQANLEGANLDLATANSIIENKINVELEPLKQKMEFAKVFVERNWDKLDKADQRFFENLQTEDDRNFELKKMSINDAHDMFKTAAQNGAPSSVLSSILSSINSGDYTKAQQLATPFQSKEADVSTQVVEVAGGRKLLINSKTGETIREVGSDAVGPGDTSALSYAESSINDVQNLISSNALGTAVGPNFLVGPELIKGAFRKSDPYTALTGQKQNFIAGVEQLRSQLTLDSLINAKARGATFGALSEGELQVLSSSASKIGTWAIVKDGRTVGYNASEKSFRKELEKINNFAKLDYIKKGGNPESVGVKVMPNGAYVVRNEDGSYTEL